MTASPNTSEEVAAFLRERQTPIRIDYKTSSIDRGDILSLAHLNSVLLYEPEEMIISVGAGISLRILEQTLCDRGQWVPTLAANEVPEETLGDAIVHDHYHPRAKTLGMLRTSILGGTFCTTNGELFKSGSRVVKSVAGYDIHRAFCGSQGKFGAIISVTLKVQPKPEMFFRFVSPSNDRNPLRSLSPSILEPTGDDLIVELAGYKEDIEADVTSLRNSGMIRKEITSNDWTDVLTRIRSERPQNAVTPEVVELLSRVQRVFDPKHILQ